MIESNFVKRVEQRQTTLNLVCLDHAFHDIFNFEDCPASDFLTGSVGPRYPVSDCKYTTEVVGRMPPFCRQPTVVVVEPPDHGANVEGAIDRVENVRCSGHTSAIGNNSPLDCRTEKFCAFFKSQSFQPAA